MKKILQFQVLILFFLTLSLQLKAAHIIGGEITYECLGYTNGDPATNSKTYRFTMRIYRDCQGGGADFDSGVNGAFVASVTIYQGQGASSNEYTTLYLEAPTETFIDPNPGNPCVQIPNNVCVEEGVYVFPPIDLPIIDDSYFVAYQRCCRNNSISNIVNPGGSGATYFMELTSEAQAVCNSSPKFNNFPPIILCVGQPFSFDFSATDVDGDQLVYELCTPVLGGGLNFDDPDAPNGIAPNPDQPPPYTGVEFLAPNFTALNPLGSTANLNINVANGQLTGDPQITGQFVVGVCVSEYRNGVLMSTVSRDFQFNITPCEPTVVADVSEDEIINDEFVINSCGETDLTIFNQSFQAQFIDEFQWEFLIDGGTVIVNDWNASVAFPGPGSFQGRLILNPGTGCGDTARILVNIYPGIEADFNFAYDTCVAGPVTFTDLSNAESGVITTWNWDFGDSGGSSNPDPGHLFTEPGIKNVNLRIKDINGCEANIQKDIRYFPVPALIVVAPDVFIGCNPGTIVFTNLSSPVDETYDVFWDFGDGTIVNELSPVHVYTEANLFTIGVEIISPIGCRTDTLFEDLIAIEPSPIADFTFSPDNPDNFNPEVEFTDQSSGANRWFWDFNGKATSILQDPIYSFPDTGQQVVTQIVTHPSGCQDSLTQIVDVEPKVTFFMPNAFTPNDDSVNDIFVGKGFLRGYKDYNMQIWNRWGEMIFESNDPEEGWNGLLGNNGHRAPAGLYLYYITLKGPRGEKTQIKGYATLIR